MNRTIRAFDGLYGYMFCMSYHFITKNQVKVYWCANGSILRIYSKDYAKIWPKYFRNDINGNQQIVDDKLLDGLQEFEDIKYDRFCKNYHILNKFNNDGDYVNKTIFGGINMKLEIKKELEQKYPYKNVGDTYMTVLREQEYDTEGIMEDILDLDGSCIIDHIIEQNINVTDDDYQQILNIILPIVQKHRNYIQLNINCDTK